MPTFLNLHRESSAAQSKTFRGSYRLRSADFSLGRETGLRGDISSEVKGGKIKLVLADVGDGFLSRWIFSDSIREDGEVVTMDLHDHTVEKFSFAGATVRSYRIAYDQTADRSLSVELVVEAAAIETDNNLFFEKR